MALVRGLKTQRERLEIKQEAVAAFLNMEPRNYRRYESGEILGERDIAVIRDSTILRNYIRIFEYLKLLPIYVSRGIEEAAQTALRMPRKPLLIIGPEGIGKTLFVEHLLLEESIQPDAPVQIRIRIGREQDPGTVSLETLLTHLALALADSVPGAAGGIRERWAGPEPAASKLTHLLETEVLPRTERLVVVFEHVERLRSPVRAALFGMLRGFMERDMLSAASWWPRLRLALSAAATPDQLEDDDTASPFLQTALHVSLEDFALPMIRELCARHELPVDTRDIEIGMELLAGHPSLWTMLIEYCKNYRQGLRALLANYRERHGIFQFHLRSLRRWLDARTFLRPTLEAILAQQKLLIDLNHYGQLFGMGLVCEEGPRSYRIRNGLYREYLHELWGGS